MTLSDRNEVKVRSALAALVDETPVGAEFDELTATQLTPTRRRRSGALAFGVAFLVVGLIGGLMVWTTRDVETSNGPAVAAAQDLTWVAWFERTRADSTQVNDSPQVLQGQPGPEPQFDVSRLGDEQRLAPLTADSTIDWAIFEAASDRGPILVSGWTPGPVYIGVAQLTTDGQRFSNSAQPSVCTFALDAEGLTTSCHDLSPASDEMADYGATIASTEDPEGDPDILTITTPPGASVVAISVAGHSYWQRPNANMATLVGEFRGQQVDIVIYDPQGDVLYEESVNL